MDGEKEGGGKEGEKMQLIFTELTDGEDNAL